MQKTPKPILENNKIATHFSELVFNPTNTGNKVNYRPTLNNAHQTLGLNRRVAMNLFRLNKLQASSLLASVMVLGVGYIALPTVAPSISNVTPTKAAHSAVVMALPTSPVEDKLVDTIGTTKVSNAFAPLPTAPTSLQHIEQSKLLRVATVNNGTTYTADDGFAHGFGFDVARRYAHKLKVNLKVIAYNNEQAAFAAVQAGQADIALTTGQNATEPTKSGFQKASFSASKASNNPKNPSKSTAMTALSLSCNQSNLKNTLDSHGLSTKVSWVLPASATDLTANAKGFLCDGTQLAVSQKMAEFYSQNILKDSFSLERFNATMKNTLPVYQTAFEQNAKAYDHDWRLLVAVGYQESQLQSDAISPTGVRGLMMLTGDTAEAMGVANRNDASQSIAGGAKYLAMLNKQFSDVPNPDRLWFTLASYNMGVGAINSIQNTLNSQGRNGNSWAEVYRFLSIHSSENSRYGQCMSYVTHIRGYLDALKFDENKFAAPATNQNSTAQNSSVQNGTGQNSTSQPPAPHALAAA